MGGGQDGTRRRVLTIAGKNESKMKFNAELLIRMGLRRLVSRQETTATVTATHEALQETGTRFPPWKTTTLLPRHGDVDGDRQV